MQPRCLGPPAHQARVGQDAEQIGKFGIDTLHFRDPQHRPQVLVADAPQIFGHLVVTQILEGLVQGLDIVRIQKLRRLESQLRMFGLRRQELKQLAHLLHAGHIGNQAGHDQGVVGQSGRRPNRESHSRNSAADVQPGDDRLHDQGQVRLPHGKSLAVLLQIRVNQRELRKGGLLHRFRRSEFEDVPFPHIRLHGVFHPQFNGILPGNRVRHGFQVVAEPPLPIAHHLATLFLPCSSQDQHLQIAGNSTSDLTVTIKASHAAEIVPVIHLILTGDPQLSRVLRSGRRLQQG